MYKLGFTDQSTLPSFLPLVECCSVVLESQIAQSHALQTLWKRTSKSSYVLVYVLILYFQSMHCLCTVATERLQLIAPSRIRFCLIWRSTYYKHDQQMLHHLSCFRVSTAFLPPGPLAHLPFPNATSLFSRVLSQISLVHRAYKIYSSCTGCVA